MPNGCSAGHGDHEATLGPVRLPHSPAAPDRGMGPRVLLPGREADAQRFREPIKASAEVRTPS
ncbi:hypothetical protein GCM10020229_71020 [Kitasatospora albolonga]